VRAGTGYVLTIEREEVAMAVEIWSYREEVTDLDLSDFKVVASDGEIGKVDEASYETGAGLIIVDTGPWILGKKVMLPAGTIERVDLEEHLIHVDRTKDEIKAAPEFDPSGYADQEYRISVGEYYSGLYS
jgi:ribosomal 30S subunit maturation factor RimM